MNIGPPQLSIFQRPGIFEERGNLKPWSNLCGMSVEEEVFSISSVGFFQKNPFNRIMEQYIYIVKM